MTQIYKYEQDECFKCDRCQNAIYEGEAFIQINGDRLCMNCIQDLTKYASMEDSSYTEHINNIIHENIENDNKRNKVT